MKSKFMLTMVLGSFLMASPLMAERYRSVDKSAHKTKKLLNDLRSYHVKFGELLTKKVKIEAWESKLKKMDKLLHSEYKAATADEAKVKNGKMSQAEFDHKWKGTGRIEKVKQAITKFRADIVEYNKFRISYNALAKTLRTYLYKRKPTQIKVLMKDMQELILALDSALKSEQYKKAVIIASNSEIAVEFGYKK